jgi:hypothetical protein
LLLLARALRGANRQVKCYGPPFPSRAVKEDADDVISWPDGDAKATSTIDVVPLTLHIGAEIRGVDLTMRGFVDGPRGMHAFVLREAGPRSEYNERVKGRVLRSEHPLVIVHAETGERVLYVCPSFLKSIVGLTPRESQKILEILWEHVTCASSGTRESRVLGQPIHRASALQDVFEPDFDRQRYCVTLVGEPLVGIDGSSSASIEGEPILSAAEEPRMRAAAE